MTGSPDVDGAGPSVGASKLDGGAPLRSAGCPSVGSRRPVVRDGKRDRRVPLKVTADELAALRDRAANQGWSVARLLVSSALEAPPASSAEQQRAEIEALVELRRLLANATGNLNQLARHANTSGDLPAATLLARVLAEAFKATACVRLALEERR